MTQLPGSEATLRVNRALHEARRPLQRLALLPSPPAEVDRIAAALEEIDAAVNGVTPPSLIASADLRRIGLVAAIENILVNALEHGVGAIEISASLGEDATLVVRNRARPRQTGQLADPRRGHGLDVIARAARQAGGSFELHNDGAGAVAMLALGSGAVGRADP